ncbi:Non-specific serine/threonine protein kinase protein [Dioscorea alata]|uniref:Non-specific serine/threonine protein kinase protein n=2 Tax=Dioscorea alata TaxID=55571 RepID=A0ACB7TZK5_DIOAL|nr:Non-specific serine/threonine protein kinase protein [Dioscorea alata]KAH7653475.1 Non-specific serine/threonine protein kinase protein [Dioscorea alata]
MKRKRAKIHILLLCFLALLHQSQGQSNGYNCSDDRTIYPCRAYAFYRAAAEQDLATVGDLFGVSRLMIGRASNLSLAAAISPGDPLLIPLTCTCGGATSNLSYAPTTYQILSGDTFYAVSTYKFQNLTAYPAVEAVNPTLIPTQLQIGVDVTFPIFCQCPSKSSKAMAALITYVFQPSDSYRSIASNFGSDVPSLVSMNGPETKIMHFTTVLVPISRIPPSMMLNRSSALLLPPPRSTDDHRVVVGLTIGVATMVVLWVLLLSSLAWQWRRRWRARRGQSEKTAIKKKKKKMLGSPQPSDEYLTVDISDLLDKYRVFELDELRHATSDFDRSRLINGSVFKGIINGQVFAIKRMKWDATDELKILQKVNHSNLVKLEGFCIDQENNGCYLVYEYIPNGSLHDWLHSPAMPHKLQWRTRLRIALDLANALQYIHEHTWPRVVHKDIKSTNVLLDTTMKAKIANFGLARSGCNAFTTRIIGTQGYVSPEYLSDGLVTTKMDVFAYGVILLELISGREAVHARGELLWMSVDKVFDKMGVRRDELRLWMDEFLVHMSCSMESVVIVLGIARACLNRDPSKRPSMVDVAYLLSKVDDLRSDFSQEELTVANGEVKAR